jgi:uncharacterized membrane protein/glutaredoxin
MIRVSLYTKQDCTLCDEVKALLQELGSEIPHQLTEVDIEADPALHKRYVESIPIVKAGPYTLQAPIEKTQLRVTLMAARDAQDRKPQPSRVSQSQAVGLHKALLFLARRWLLLLNLVVFIYVGLPFAAPVLMNAGMTRTAEVIYKLYGPLCHQLAFRSWFLFGEQPAYPTELAGSPLTTYAEATGFDETDYWVAREFVGTKRLGFKVALCQRDIGIYVGILIAGLLYSTVRGRLKPLPLRIWLLLGVLPIALDGGTQLLSALPILSLPARESTPFLRTLTGGLFGVVNVWLAYPYLEASMQDVRATVAAKLAGAGVRISAS